MILVMCNYNNYNEPLGNNWSSRNNALVCSPILAKDFISAFSVQDLYYPLSPWALKLFFMGHGWWAALSHLGKVFNTGFMLL